MGMIRGSIFFLLLVLGIGFAIRNDQPTSLKYYFDWVSPPLPLFLWAFLFLLVGLILSALWASFFRLGLRSRIRQRKKTIAELERRRDHLKEGKSPL